jgi:tRNA-dihydrouridine synthase A
VLQTDYLLSIAPMIDWTYTHFRVWMRLLAPQSLLYTEMQTTGALSNNPRRALAFNPIEHPLAIQLGGSDITALAQSARAAEQEGYDEINLNLGCPSDKVQAGRFGACLMQEPDHVAACIRAMKQAVSIPVTSKTRIGIDHQDSYEFFKNFVMRLVDAGSDKIIVHARKAWLHGLNPKQNRTVPPVHYDYVYKIKKELPQTPVIINGNIGALAEIKEHLNYVDGVMLGRLLNRSQLVQSYFKYMLQEYHNGVALSLLIKPIFNLAHGMAGARQWKKKLMLVLQSKDVFLIDGLVEFMQELERVNSTAILE